VAGGLDHCGKWKFQKGKLPPLIQHQKKKKKKKRLNDWLIRPLTEGDLVVREISVGRQALYPHGPM
jgi:hypothetical protein